MRESKKMRDWSTLAGRIAHIVGIVGSQKALSEKSGVALRTISSYANGKETVTTSKINALASAVDVDEDWLLTGKGDPDGSSTPFLDLQERSNLVLDPTAEAAADEEFARDFSRGLAMARFGKRQLGDVASAPVAPLSSDALVPVRGTAAGALAGSMAMSGDAVGYVRRPTGLEDILDAYALFVVNNSMLDRYRPGDLVFVHPYKPYRRGDIVIVQTQTHDGGDVLSYIKEFVSEDKDRITALQYNKRATVEFMKSSVKSVHKVMTANELYGV